MLFNIPKLQTINIAHAVTPTIPVTVLALFLNISLIFHFVLKLIFLNIPTVVIFKELFFTFGISFLKVSAVFSFNIFLVAKYVTNDTHNVTRSATIYESFLIIGTPFGISKKLISIPINTFPIKYLPPNNPNIDATNEIQNP